MSQPIEFCNRTALLADCRDAWAYDEAHGIWCLENVLYTQVPTCPRYQTLSIYVPGPYFSAPGVVDPQGQVGRWTAQTAPVILSNNSGGYMQMPDPHLDSPILSPFPFLERGHVYVTCGNRGRGSVDQDGKPCGYSPANLVDLKMVVRFLRHNKEALPGNLERIVSIGGSAGGAMSTLLSVTGNSPRYDNYLRDAGAFMEERDDIFAGQIYCPITNLSHADAAYEWTFRADKKNEASPAGPAGQMTPFEEALSQKLSEAFVRYFNDLKLPHPITGKLLTIGEDGRSGSGYDYLMGHLNRAASKYLTKLGRGQLDVSYSAEDYLSGNYKKKVMAPPPPGKPGGPGKPPMVEVPGNDKRGWLTWKAGIALISDLDTYVLSHRRRMKPCTAFDQPHLTSGENEVFGTPGTPGCHFSEDVFRAICLLKDQFPGEYEALSAAWAKDLTDQELQERTFLYDPMNFIGTQETCDQAIFYRIRVGASDADTSFMISAILALALCKAGKKVTYQLVWEQPHGDADYPGELVDWIDQICK
jgi:hypothetical protein